jgi:hypothetical protein
MLDDALLFASATRLLGFLRAREISSRELVDLHLAHIGRERALGGYRRPPLVG